MKRIILSSLLSCLLVGQVFGASTSEEPVPSLHQLCVRSLLNEHIEHPHPLNQHLPLQSKVNGAAWRAMRDVEGAERPLHERADVDGLTHGNRISQEAEKLTASIAGTEQKFPNFYKVAGAATFTFALGNVVAGACNDIGFARKAGHFCEISGLSAWLLFTCILRKGIEADDTDFVKIGCAGFLAGGGLLTLGHIIKLNTGGGLLTLGHILNLIK